MKLSFLKNLKYRKEYTKISEELEYKRNSLTDLFLQIEADENRSVETDMQLERRNKEVNRLICRLIELDKLINGKKSKY